MVNLSLLDKRRSTLWLVLLCLVVSPLIQAQDNTRNFVLTRSYKVPLTNAAEPVSAGEANLSLDYFDGLGRLGQTIKVQAGSGKRDIVIPVEYDAQGRLSKSYLPAITSSQNGAFQTAATTLVSSYYNSDARFVDFGQPVFSESRFEASPLNRPTAQISAGTSQPVTITYGVNDGGNVRLYQAGTGLTDITRSGYYGANQLTSVQTIDEEGKQTTEFKDKDGRMVLRRAGSGEYVTNTYFVYDDLNQLRAVLQPLFDNIGSPTSADLTSYSFLYRYDARGRLVQKQVPSSGPTTLEYNAQDLLIKTTDANGNIINTSYDALNRPTQTSRGDGQPLSYYYYDHYNGLLPNNESLKAALSFVSGASTYSWSSATDFVPNSVDEHKRKGQLTGQCMRLLNSDGSLSGLWTCSAQYYDDRYRVVQTVRQLTLGNSGLERVSYKRDFSGKVLGEKTTQSWSGQSYTLEKTFNYDHSDRLTATRYQFSSNGNAIPAKDIYVNALTYNEVGQLTVKFLNATDGSGSKAIERLNYKYDLRGWLRQHRASQRASRPFGLTLNYERNGNVTNLGWQYPSAGTAGSYQFKYDPLNRLEEGRTGVNAGQGESVRYDLNGNIKTLERYNPSGNMIDQLAYKYDNTQGVKSNQLKRVDDNSGPEGFNNGISTPEEYIYDNNGNLTLDKNRGGAAGLSVAYNYLNLPRQVTLDGSTMSYIYDAAGEKRSMNVGGVVTQYEGIFEYNGASEPTRVMTDEGQLVKDGNEWRWQYYLKDHLGNVRVVLDEAGNVVQETDYYPFGLAIAKNPGDLNQSRSKNKYLYLNRELQQQTGWLDLKARYYDPVVGRFLTVDPLTEAQEQLTPYHYGYDNPLRFSDPNGKMGDDCCGGVISYVAGVGSALRDNFGSADGSSLYRDNVSDKRSYNSGRELGHQISLVASAAEIALGLLGDGAALTGEIASLGLATPVAAGLAIASTGAVTHGLNSANNAISNSKDDKGRLYAKSGSQESHQTYTKTNSQTGEVYSGRTKGTGTPEQNIAKRDSRHHMNNKGFGKARLDQSSLNKDAIRGREQQLIEKNGGAKSSGGTSGNQINGIGPKNSKGQRYRDAANKEFGPL